MLAIVITDSSGNTHYHPLPAETGRSYSLGRAENCDFSLPHEQTISDVHCFLSLVDGYVYLQDNNSTNGILAESRRVTAEYMATEREYTLGSCRLLLLQTEETAAAQPVAQAPVRKVAKLKPKAVSTAPAPQPAPEPLQPAYTEPQTVYEQPQPQPARRVAKLKAKTVTAAAPPTPVYVQPVYAEPQPEPVTVQPTEVYAEPQPEPVAVQPTEVYAEPQPEPVAVQPTEVYVEPQPEPVAVQPTEVNIEPQPLAPAPAPDVPATQTASLAESTTKKTPKRSGTRVHATKAGRAAAKAIYEPEAPRSGNLAALPQDFGLKLRLINDKNALTVGTPLRFGFTADQNCFIYLLQYDSSGQAALLIPGDEDVAHKLFKDIETQFPSISCKDYDLMVEEPVGHEIIIALACTVESNFAEVWQGMATSAADMSPGETELQAIAATKAPNGIWSSFVLNIHTKH